MNTQRRLVRISARIPAELFCRFEDERHRRTVHEHRRMSANDLLTLAIESFLSEPSHADDSLS